MTDCNSVDSQGRLQELSRAEAVKTEERVGNFVEAVAGVMYSPRRRTSHRCVSTQAKHSVILNRVGKEEGSIAKQQVAEAASHPVPT